MSTTPAGNRDWIEIVIIAAALLIIGAVILVVWRFSFD